MKFSTINLSTLCFLAIHITANCCYMSCMVITKFPLKKISDFRIINKSLKKWCVLVEQNQLQELLKCSYVHMQISKLEL